MFVSLIILSNSPFLSMNVPLYLSIYLSIYLSTHTHTHTYVYACVCVNVCVCVRMTFRFLVKFIACTYIGSKKKITVISRCFFGVSRAEQLQIEK